MNSLRPLLATVLAASALVALPAFAIQRTFVASFGNDANACTLTSPCRGFTRALTQTDANGEVIVLDSAGYGPVAITQSVSIIAPEGVYAGISVFSGQIGVSVSAAGGKVTLRGLSVNGQGGGPGILVTSGDEVHIERCTVSNVTGIGIDIDGGTAVYVSDSVVRGNSGNGIMLLGGAPDVFVSDTRVADNAQNGIVHQSGTLTLDRVQVQRNGLRGLAVNPDATTTRTRVRDSQFSRNLHGLTVSSDQAGDIATVTIEGSAAFNQVNDGFSVQGSFQGVASMVVSGSVVSGNGNIGIGASGNATVFVTGSTVTGNGVGFSQTVPASFFSMNNNTRRANGSDFSGSIVPLALQ